MKEILNISRGFDKLTYKSYERRRTKHDPTESYFYLSRQLEKCVMRAYVLNSENYPLRTEITGAKHIPISQVFSTGYRKSKYFLVRKNLSGIYSMGEGGSKIIIADEISTEESKS